VVLKWLLKENCDENAGIGDSLRRSKAEKSNQA
jgi:hypothetical protein